MLTLALLALLVLAKSEVFFEEKFDDSWATRWSISDWKKDDGQAGEWKHTAGKYYNDESEDKGIQTYPDARFFAISSKLDKPFSNKEKDLIFQFQVKHEQKIDCGGGYAKLMSGDVDQAKFSGDTPYEIMFGPDICGYSTKRVHAIITHENKNLLIKKTVDCETDELSHVYTFVLSPNNTYKILIDLDEKSSGSIFDEWDFLKPKTIPDPDAKKPEDWVDEEMIEDPEDSKPEDWVDGPIEIVDPEATKPEDWDDAEDGEWEPPLVPNPDFKGEWKPKRIKNPAYKGKWKAPVIDNPEYVDKPEAYVLPPITYVGFELWQVKAGSIFDNILVTDDLAYAVDFANKTWGKLKEVEKTKFEEDEKKRMEEEKVDEEEEDFDDEDMPEAPEEDDAEEEDIEEKTETKDEL